MLLHNVLYKRHLEEGEEILAVAHRHWFMLKKKIWKASTFGIVPPLVIFYFFPGFWPILLIWLLIGVFFYILKFLEWYFDCFLITKIGVIDVERRGIFDNTSKRIDYNTIDGISYEIKGFLPTILNYGDIRIDKMGSGVRIDLNDAANPGKVNKLIMKYQGQFVTEKSFTDHEALKGMLADMIASHVKKYGVKPVSKK